MQQLEVLLQLQVVFLKEAIKCLLHVSELGQESRTHIKHRLIICLINACFNTISIILKTTTDRIISLQKIKNVKKHAVPLNSVHVCLYVRLLLYVSLRGLDSL